MSSYLLVFTVSNDCKCLGCRETPWERARGATLTHRNVFSQSCPGRNPAKGPGKKAPRPSLKSLNHKTCVSQGPSLMFSWSSCPIFISGMKGLLAVRRVTDSRWQRGITLPLPLPLGFPSVFRV